MTAFDVPQSILILALSGVLCAWIPVIVFVVWRSRKQARELAYLKSQSSFFDSLLSSDRRFPIWIWASGRVQADQSAFTLLNLTGNIDELEDLIGEAGSGLTRDTVERLRAGATGAQGAQQPLVVRYGSERPPVLIDIQRLNPGSDDWPTLVLWLEETAQGGLKGGTSSGLRALEDRLADFTRIFDALPLPVWVRSSDGSLYDVNSTYAAAVECDDSAQVVRDNTDLFPDRATQDAKKALSDRAPVLGQYSAVIDGTVREFSVIHRPLKGGQVLGVALDMSAEHQATRELGRVIKSNNETLNQLRTPVAIFGTKQSLKFFNLAFARLSQVPESILVSGISHSELLDEMRDRRRLPEQADYKGWKKAHLKLYSEVLKEPAEEIWYLPDGTAHRLVIQSHPQSGLLILFEDITDTLTLEQNYNTLIAVQQETLDSMREGVAVFSTGLSLELSNPAFKSMWGLEGEDALTGRHVTELLRNLPAVTHSGSDVEDSEFKTQLPAWLSGRKSHQGRWHRRDGQVFDYALVSLPDGGMMLTQVDVTDSFKVQQALQERGRALEVADRLKNQFITNMSYELRTPLNSIIGFAQLLEQQLFGPLNEIQDSYIGDILQAAEELKSMISDVLDLAVIEAGEADLDIQHVDMVAALNDSALLAQDMAHKANMLLTIEAESEVRPVMGDPRRLKQALYNMISTMLMLGKFGGKLTLTLDWGTDYCRVSVTNLDCGLSVHDREILISNIEMGGVHSGRRATGLDLALVRSIIRLHGGEVRLEAVGTDGLSLHCLIPRTQKPTRVISGDVAS